jgi:hypothetical protein
MSIVKAEKSTFFCVDPLLQQILAIAKLEVAHIRYFYLLIIKIFTKEIFDSGQGTLECLPLEFDIFE